MRKTFLPLTIAVLFLTLSAHSQVTTNTAVLQRAQREAATQEATTHQRILKLAAEKGWPLRIGGKNGRVAILVDIDVSGSPLYAEADNNILSAATIKTNALWPGGSTGLNLNGSTAILKSKIGIWDGGNIRLSHVELNGRVVQKDNTSSGFDDHATHVAGTLIASGINPAAKGMSFGAQQLIAYDFTNHLSEMLGEAPGLLVSNHSYSSIAGWRQNTDENNRWEWWGDPGATEDYKFGYYSTEAQVWDSIAYNAPNYLIVKAAGNNRSENGPAVGQPYFRATTSGGAMSAAGNRPAGISNNDSYDIIATYGTAKNILTIGAINPIAGGYTRVADAVLTDFSSWGPTDDGRIKPDVVADGSNVLSSIATSDNAYAAFSGTSMASPAAAGSMFLLQEYYNKLHSPSMMRSATLKAIVIHTADEAGDNPGPDYKYGWGVINMEKAAAVITSNNTDKLIRENVLTNGNSYTENVVASGKGPLVVTIVWTDVKGDVDNNPATRLNNHAKRLINDLDIRVTSGATTYMPWILNPNVPAAAATTGDNTLDNVEKIEIPNPIPGETYTITVTHKSTLVRAQQAYSLVVSGVGGTAYCTTSAPGSSAGPRIDNVTIGNVNNNNPAGCTTYTNYSNLIASVQQGATVPFSIAFSNCDGSGPADKIIKIFIDYNNNGVFTDAGEEVAVSGVLNIATSTYTGNIAIPNTVPVNNLTRMRVILQQTSSAAAVVPCGPYSTGETQDYSILFTNPSKDVGVAEVINPVSGCGGVQYVTIRLRNYGDAAQSNIPVTTTIKNGATDLATLNFTYPGPLAAQSSIVFTYSAPFTTVAGTTYTIVSKSTLAGDQNAVNDQLTTTVAVNAAGAAITGTAEKCTPTQVSLKANTSGNDVAFWYDAPNATTPIAVGNLTSTNVITSNSTYYVGVNDGPAKTGLPNKLVYSTNGAYVGGTAFLKISNSVPLTISTARLYVGAAGKVTITLADLTSYNKATGNFSYIQLASTTIDIYPTAPSFINNNNPADTGAIYRLDLPVTTTGDHILVFTFPSGGSLFYHNGVTGRPYPFSIPGVFSINGNSADNRSDTTDVNYQQNFYFYLFDVAIKLANCPGTRSSVVAGTATVPVASLSGNVLSSSATSGNQWLLNGSPIPGALGQTFNATVTGIYTVQVTDNFGCVQTSNQLNFVATGIVDVGGAEIGLRASPNPSKGQFSLQFEVRSKEDLTIDVLNTVGQTVYRQTYPSFIGQFSKEINAGKLASGMYILRIQHGQKTYIKKLLVE